MAQPQLIHRRDAGTLDLPSPAAWAIAALQQALLAVVHHHEAHQPGSVPALLESGPGPSSVAAWSERLTRELQSRDKAIRDLQQELDLLRDTPEGEAAQAASG